MRKLLIFSILVVTSLLAVSVASASDVLFRYRAITNGGGNSFAVRSVNGDCVFSVGGADVGGTESYTSVNAFLDRAADLYTNANGIADELKSHGNITGPLSGNAFAYGNGIGGFGGQGVGGNYRYQIGDPSKSGKYWLNNNWGGTTLKRAQNFEKFLEAFIPYFEPDACATVESVLAEYCPNPIDTTRDNWGNGSRFVDRGDAQFNPGKSLMLSGEGVPGQCFIPLGKKADIVWEALPKNN